MHCGKPSRRAGWDGYEVLPEVCQSKMMHLFEKNGLLETK
jgi:hypothetical protein